MSDISGDIANTIMGWILKGLTKGGKVAAQAAYGAYNKSKEQAETEDLTRKAANDDPDAQFSLGMKLLNQEGITQETAEKAIDMIIAAAKDGNDGARAFLESLQ